MRAHLPKHAPFREQPSPSARQHGIAGDRNVVDEDARRGFMQVRQRDHRQIAVTRMLPAPIARTGGRTSSRPTC